MTFYEDPGTDVPWESSDSVGSEPVSSPIDDDGGCGADTNCDGDVNVTDLLAVISSWGPCMSCDADVNSDDTVDVSDLLMVIDAWGSCG